MTLKDCSQVWGDQILLETPRMRLVEGGVIVPKRGLTAYDFDPAWGVYDDRGARVEAASYRRGPGVNYVGQSPVIQIGRDEISDAVEDEVVYGGVGHGHFGHFVVSTLARLWAAPAVAGPDAKYVFHVEGPLEAWLARPFVATCLDALGIDRAQVVALDRPLRFKRLWTPEPSFEETRAYHPVFRETALRIGDRLDAEPIVPKGAIVYLSKERLTGGVKRFSNETALVDHLRARGVTIVHPEAYDLGRQVGLFRDASVVMGSLSSAFHTSIFSSARTRLVGLNHDANVFSTFSMIDAMTGNPARYVHQQAEADANGDPRFLGTFALQDPVAAAEELLMMAEQETHRRRTWRTLFRWPR